jgi:hypothetical protein
MLKYFLTFVTALLLVTSNNAQTKVNEDMEPAILNAKKGIFWVLSNIPSKKAKLDHDLIANDKLTARVKLEKGIGGVKIESTGYSETISVTITLYKSYDNLKKEGYIKKIEEPEFE